MDPSQKVSELYTGVIYAKNQAYDSNTMIWNMTEFVIAI